MLCCLVLFTGFVCSRALASIGMISILVAVVLFTDTVQTIRTYFFRKEFWVLSIFFWIVFVSGIYSDDKADWLNWVRIKLPYIALPLAFAGIKKLDERKFIAIISGFILVFFVSTVAVLTNYFLHYSEITDAMTSGGGIPMPFSRIRYTLMLAFAFFCCVYLLENKLVLFSKKEKGVQIFFVVFSFVALHILTVRSSLLALYLGIFFLLLRFIFVQKKFLPGGVLLLLTALMPYLALQFIPSLQNKWSYMSYDRNALKEGHLNNLSDGVRLVSMRGGWEVAKKHWLIGVGAGDLKTEMEVFYKNEFRQLEKVDHKMPHNQLIWVLATTGIIGFSLFLFAFLFPFLSTGIFRNPLAVVLYLIIFSSFFTEATLEEQMGTGFYLIFLLLFINQAQKE